MIRTIAIATLFLFAGLLSAEDGVTKIHLDQYNGYFSSPNVFMNLKPGTYEFTVTNKAGKLAGFLLQDPKDGVQLALGLIKEGETATYQVVIDSNGFRYRCPINPTPWYDVGVDAK
jgi:hypothetical protein